ncbi:hypothetical protein E4U14_007411 [Claviceps sp. LM454 group G7]|nr:hypothetical protein E4U14_007411 [Claviceps sp. LM454 group G7]
MSVPRNQCPKQETHPQPRIEGKLDHLTKEVADIPSKVCDELMKRCVETEKQLKTKSKEAAGLRSEIQSLKAQLQQEKADGQDKVEQLQKKSKEAKELRSELQSLRKQLEQQKADSQKKVAGLTPMIQGLSEDMRKLLVVTTRNALRHKVSHDDIKKYFVNIRRQVEALVDNPLYDKTLQIIPYDMRKESDMRLKERWDCYNTESRVLVMRSIVYLLLFHHILDAFGPVGDILSRHHHWRMAPRPLLRRLLGDFDDLFTTGKGAVVLYLLFSASSHANKPLEANEVTFDLRLRTFEYAENFSVALPARDGTIARLEIQCFLGFFLNYKQDVWKTREEINRLCDDAFDLSLFTRVSGHGYELIHHIGNMHPELVLV